MNGRTRPDDFAPLRPVPALPVRDAERLQRVFKALAHPARLEILRLLARQPSATCACDIVEHFDLSQPTISHHLRVLREAGLVTSRRRGLWSFYRAERSALQVLSEFPAWCSAS
ncbi:MAG: winged helix-turn-helix transcriptional regulator [Myxococcales bacterium]|nr:winged helix-turn-helix transcriptional regulator [Myxococcales bacterium]